MEAHPPTWTIPTVLEGKKSEVVHAREHATPLPKHLHNQGKNWWGGTAETKMRCENYTTIRCANKFPCFNVKDKVTVSSSFIFIWPLCALPEQKAPPKPTDWQLAYGTYYWPPNKNCTQMFPKVLELYKKINRRGTVPTSLRWLQNNVSLSKFNPTKVILCLQKLPAIPWLKPRKTNMNSKLHGVLGWPPNSWPLLVGTEGEGRMKNSN